MSSAAARPARIRSVTIALVRVEYADDAPEDTGVRRVERGFLAALRAPDSAISAAIAKLPGGGR